MPSQTAPSGRCTLGRVGLPPTCARSGNATNTRTATGHLIYRLKRDRLRAGTKALPFNPELVQHAEEHVRRSFRVIRINDVPVALEVPVEAAEQNDGHLYMGVAMRVANVADCDLRSMFDVRSVLSG